MSLRKKTLIIFGIILVFLVIAAYLISHKILLKNFENMENSFCERYVKIAFDNMNDEIGQIRNTASDWSVWDDTYNFIQQKNDEYIKSNLAFLTFKSLNVNAMLFYDLNGNLVYEKGYDLETFQEKNISMEFIDQISGHSKLLNHKSTEGCMGILTLKSGPAMVVSRPILKSNGKGPSVGNFVIIRILDKQQLARFSRVLHANLEIKPIDEITMPKDYSDARKEITDKKPIAVVRINENSIAGYKVVKDVFEKPSFLMRIDVPRDIYKNGRQISFYFTVFSVIAFSMFLILTIVLNERIIIRRLLELEKNVLEIGQNSDFSQRVAIVGNDELSRLSGTINGMLGSLEQHIYQLTDRTEQLEEIKAFQVSVFNTVSSGVCILDSNDKVRNCNTSLLNMLGFNAGEVLDKKVFEFFPDSYLEKLKLFRIELMNKGKVRFETYLIKNDKSTFPAEIYVSLLKNKGDKINSAVVVINDITERKKAETALKRKSEEQALLLDNTDIQIWYMKDPETYGSVNNAHAMSLGMEKIFIENQKIYKVYENKEVADKLVNVNKDTFTSKKGKQFEIEYMSKSGFKKILLVTTTPKLDGKGNVEYIICTAEDITVRKEAEEKIKYLSYHDKLTGLYNRAYFEDELKRLENEGVLPLSILIGDINGLKIANDVFGHDEGDKLLIRISDILMESCRDGDIVARWGGDEFAIILPYTSEDIALGICKSITEKCEESSNGLIISNIALGASTREDITKETSQMIKEAEDRMYRHKLLENRSSRSSYVSLLEKTLFERNYETEEHAKRMCELSIKMGKFIGLPDNKLDELSLLAALHDIGKIAIPDNILLKPGPLTEEEYEIMKKHPEIGYRIAVLSPELAPIADAILTHHERWDGKGYPQGLKSEEIQVISRIISIVDTYDVMTHKRPYKEAVSREEALSEIKRCAGSQFDPQLAYTFISLLEQGDI